MFKIQKEKVYPKISVLMTVYNAEKYICESIESILNQTFLDFEFIIINDASTDSTEEILKGYNDSRIKIIKNKENMGQSKSANIGLRLARGEYIARQDGDDISVPDRLRKQIDFLEKHMDCSVVGSFIKVIDENSRELYPIEKPISHIKIKEFLKKDNCIAHGSALIRMKDLRDIGFYDEFFPKALDYDLFIRFSEKYRLANLPEYLYYWRRHSESISVAHYNEQQHFVRIAKLRAEKRRQLKTPGKILPDENSVKPKFSVLMANYNNGEFVGKAIQSIMDQTFQDWELVVVDDASTDNSVELIKKYLKDKRIRFFKNESNIGYISTLNKMVYESFSDIFGILDSDDALIKNALEVMYNAHITNPDCGFIYSQFMYCDVELNPYKEGCCQPVPKEGTNLRCNCVSAFRTFKKRDYFKTEGFSEDILGAEDKDIIFKMEEVTKLLFVNEILYMYRVLPDSQAHDPVISKHGIIHLYLAKYNAYMRRMGSNIPNLNRWEMIHILLDGIKFCFKQKRFNTAKNFIKKIFIVLRGMREKALYQRK